MKRIWGSFFALCSLWIGAQAFANPYQVIQTTNTVIGELTRTDIVVQVGSNPINRFTMHRVRKTGKNGGFKGLMLLLNPLGQSFKTYEFDENSDYLNSTAGYLAKQNIDVFGYSPRGHWLVAGQCESGAYDCSEMQNWGLQSIVNDVAYFRQYIASIHPTEKPAIGGLSMGAMSAIAVVNSAPNDYAGLLLWEGMLFSNDLVVNLLNVNWCASGEAQLASGSYYDSASSGLFKQLAANAQADPTGPDHIALVTFMSNPPPSPATTPTPGYYFAAGNPLANSFTYASDARVIGSILTAFGDYAPNRVIRDVSCSLAGDQTFTGNLAQFTKPVYSLGGTNGFGGHMQGQLSLFGSTSISSTVQANFGHVDHYWNPNHLYLVEQPIYQWLTTVVFP